MTMKWNLSHLRICEFVKIGAYHGLGGWFTCIGVYFLHIERFHHVTTMDYFWCVMLMGGIIGLGMMGFLLFEKMVKSLRYSENIEKFETSLQENDPGLYHLASQAEEDGGKIIPIDWVRIFYGVFFLVGILSGLNGIFFWIPVGMWIRITGVVFLPFFIWEGIEDRVWVPTISRKLHPFILKHIHEKELRSFLGIKTK